MRGIVMSEFERLYKLSQEKCIEECGELYEVYDEFQMKSMCEYFFSLGNNNLKAQVEQLISENKKLREAGSLLRDTYSLLYSEEYIKQHLEYFTRPNLENPMSTGIATKMRNREINERLRGMFYRIKAHLKN